MQLSTLAINLVIMSTPFNKPTFEELAEGTLSLPPTYESLADLTEVKPASIYEGWVFANLETSWEEALKFMQEMSAKEITNEAGIKNSMGGFAGLLKDLLFCQCFSV